MITFVDGPARGALVTFSRAPMFLRVVRSRVTGRWRAIDQVGDAPRSTEEVHIYRLTLVLTDYRDKQGRVRGTTIQTARYRHFAAGGSDETVRRNDLWRKWCESIQRLEAEAAQ